MKRVVYILGAGFSAPLGLPVMSDFLHKSKDMYQRDLEKYGYLTPVFNEMNRISTSAMFYSTDVFNIEEILSILEMEKRVGEATKQQQFVDYIKAVIEHYTLHLEPHDGEWGTSDWIMNIFGSWSRANLRIWNAYGCFAASIMNRQFRLNRETGKPSGVQCMKEPGPGVHYSVITLNYDLILENLCDFINENYDTDDELSFSTNTMDVEDDPYKPVLAKLHGSVNTNIIPPTWNKNMVDSTILDAWKLAYKVLVDANYIRVIGYSLPITDTYVRYLLKSAVMHTFNLKGIDVLCQDPDGSVRKRYDSFVKYEHYRFIDTNVAEYMRMNADKARNQQSQNIESSLRMDQLEDAHEQVIADVFARRSTR